MTSTAGKTGGHIPGSFNVPYSELFDNDGCFKEPSELKKGNYNW